MSAIPSLAAVYTDGYSGAQEDLVHLIDYHCSALCATADPQTEVTCTCRCDGYWHGIIRRNGLDEYVGTLMTVTTPLDLHIIRGEN